MVHRSVSLVAACALVFGCGGGGDGRSSEVTVDVDGNPAAPTAQSTGVDAEGNTHVVVSGDGWSVEVKFPGTAPGDFATGGGAAAEVTYTDEATGVSYVASDASATSSYTITITTYDTNTLQGAFTATVVDAAGMSHTVSGTFTLILRGVSGDDPYGGTYMGIFRAEGQVLTGYDMDTGEPIWGPNQVAALRVTLSLEHIATAQGTAAYWVTHANVSDAMFGCNVGGCVPADAGGNMSIAALPAEPGTPAISGASMAGHGFVIWFSNGSQLLTQNAEGSLYTSQDARIVGSALGLDEPWLASGPGAVDYFEATFGDYYFNLNPATRKMNWALTRSAL